MPEPSSDKQTNILVGPEGERWLLILILGLLDAQENGVLDLAAVNDINSRVQSVPLKCPARLLFEDAIRLTSVPPSQQRRERQGIKDKTLTLLRNSIPDLTLPPVQTPLSDGATLPPTLLPSDGDQVWPMIPGYEIVAELGRGGMGVVYKARQIGLNRLVALKMILSGAHAGPDDLARFRSEAEAVARLQHPHIVQIHDIGEQKGLPYFSMELVDGGSLADRLNGQPWPDRQAAEFTELLARAVDAAHRKGVIHRDLKPANVLLSSDGVPKITDFGLAKRLEEQGQTRTGVVMGTPSYMAPEQAEGKNRQIGPTADVYALGVILYELLTGRPPFQAGTALDTILLVLSTDPISPRERNPEVPRDLETICLKCLSKEPEKRYGSAGDLAEDLRCFLAGDAIQARPPGLWKRFTRSAKRANAWMLRKVGTQIGTAVGSLILLSFLIPAWWNQNGWIYLGLLACWVGAVGWVGSRRFKVPTGAGIMGAFWGSFCGGLAFLLLFGGGTLLVLGLLHLRVDSDVGNMIVLTVSLTGASLGAIVGAVINALIYRGRQRTDQEAQRRWGNPP